MKFFALFAAFFILPTASHAAKDQVTLAIQLEENGKSISNMRVIANLGKKAEIRDLNGEGVGYSIAVLTTRNHDLVDMTTKVSRINGQKIEEVLHARFVAEANKPASTEKHMEGKPTLKLTVTPILE